MLGTVILPGGQGFGAAQEHQAKNFVEHRAGFVRLPEQRFEFGGQGGDGFRGQFGERIVGGFSIGGGFDVDLGHAPRLQNINLAFLEFGAGGDEQHAIHVFNIDGDGHTFLEGFGLDARHAGNIGENESGWKGFFYEIGGVSSVAARAYMFVACPEDDALISRRPSTLFCAIRGRDYPIIL